MGFTESEPEPNLVNIVRQSRGLAASRIGVNVLSKLGLWLNFCDASP
jgi:hypothetical protein